MRILALDLSARCTGHAFLIDGVVRDSGILRLHQAAVARAGLQARTPSTEVLGPLGVVARRLLGSLIDVTDPDLLVLEGVYGVGESRTVLEQLQAHARTEACERAVPVAVVEASKWRQIIIPASFWRDRSRAALKLASVEVATATLGRRPRTDDEADAVCLGLYAHQVRLAAPAPAYPLKRKAA